MPQSHVYVIPAADGTPKFFLGAALPQPPAMPPDAEAFYEGVMAQIEPELTAAQLPTLAAKYAGETQGEARARAERYAKAFAEYERRLLDFAVSAAAAARRFATQTFRAAETDDKLFDTPVLDDVSLRIASL